MHTKTSNIISIFFILAMVAGHFIFGFQIFYYLCLLLALIIHELGHYLVAKHYKYSSVKFLFMLPFGAAILSEKPIESLNEKLLMLLAGPVPGIIFGYIFFSMYLVTQNILIKQLAFAFLFVNGINLLPILPLDGGRIVRIIFLEKIKWQRLIASLSLIGLLLYLIKSGDYFLWILVIPQALDFLMVWTSRVVIIRLRRFYKVKWKAIREIPISLNFYEKGMILYEIMATEKLDSHTKIKALFIWISFTLLALFPILKMLN